MDKELEIFKKKLIYRAGYRGTKEMDILLSSFVNKYIHTFDEDLLIALDEFLKFEDETILNFYQHLHQKEQCEIYHLIQHVLLQFVFL